MWSTVFSVALSLYIITWSVDPVSEIAAAGETTSADRNDAATCQAEGSDSCEESGDHALSERPNLTVEMYGEKYQLDQVPAADTKVVLEKRGNLLGGLDLEVLINDFRRLGSFINIAYNGVGAAGPKFTEIQIEIQDIGFSVTDLFVTSALMLTKFKTSSEVVLIDIQSSYDFLIHDLEDLAFDTLSSIRDVAIQMEKAARDLHKKATEEKEKVKNTRTKTQKAKGEEALQIQKNNKERELLELDRIKQEEVMLQAKMKQQEAEDKILDFEMKEEEAIAKIGDMGFFKNLVNAATSFVGVEVFSTEQHSRGAKEEASLWRRRAKEAEERAKEYNEQRQLALDQMVEFAKKIKDCEGEEKMAEIAVDALHEAVGALQHITVVMMRIAQFWNQVQQHCEVLASDKLIKQVKFSMDNYSKQQRHTVWTSLGFKKNAVKFYAGWVAVKSVCEDVAEQIRLTQKELYKYLEENPTYEECRRNVKVLAETFLRNEEKQRATPYNDSV